MLRPRWVLPDVVGLALLAELRVDSGERGAAVVVGTASGQLGPELVLSEFVGLDRSELCALVHGATPLVAARVTQLPETLDPALGCLAPALGEARRLLAATGEGDGPWHPLVLDARDHPGGTVACARIEARRRHPDRLVATTSNARPRLVDESGTPDQRPPAVSDEELRDALVLLDAHPALFRPVIEAALARDELARLAGLLAGSSGSNPTRGRPRPLNDLSGRVLLRAGPSAMDFDDSPDEAPPPPPAPVPPPAPRPGTPGARALDKIGALPAYRRGRAASGARADGKLSANESPFGPPPAVLAALGRAAEGLNRYPEEEPVLVELAAHLGTAPERLVLTNGSDELCYLLARLVLDDAPDGASARRQGFAVVGDPCYQIDATASTLAGAPIVRVPLVGGAHDLRSMASAAREGATLVWLPSPHNPTGVAVALGELVAFLDAVPGDCLVVLDQAYAGFERDDGAAARALVEERPNLLVQRTFSKDWGLAGLRVGYAVGDPVLIGALLRARPPFSVNALALAAVSAALGCEEWRAGLVEAIVKERGLLEATLDELGVSYYPSQANFVTCALAFPEFADVLARDGLSVRDGADLGVPGWTRITIGWAPQMAALRDVLRRVAVGKGKETG